MATGARRWWREPLLHFLILGAGLYALDARRSDAPVTATGLAASATEDEGRTIRVPAALVREARAGMAGPGGRVDEAALAAELDRFVLEEAMVREARRMGLDRGDLVVRRRLVQKMSFLIEDLAEAPTPSRAELEVWYAEHPERFARPAAWTFRHVFFSRERRGAASEADARAALARDPAPSGDRFLRGERFVERDAAAVSRELGAELAAGLAACAPEVWCGPLASPFGHHLVRVESIRPASRPALEAVEAEVRADWALAARRRAIGVAQAELRGRYVVERETTTAGAAPTSTAPAAQATR